MGRVGDRFWNLALLFDREASIAAPGTRSRAAHVLIGLLLIVAALWASDRLLSANWMAEAGLAIAAHPSVVASPIGALNQAGEGR